MVFSSPVFLFLFLPAMLAAYFAAPNRFRNFVLLAASLFFYAWGEAFYVLLMLGSIALAARVMPAGDASGSSIRT